MGTSFLRLCLILAVATSSASLLAQTYKWKDDQGRTVYGDAPPPAKGAKPVDTLPFGIETDGPKECYTLVCQSARAEESKRKREEADAAAAAVRAKAEREHPPVRGMDFNVFRNLQPGMSEAELLARAGRPDLDALDNVQGLFMKTYSYLPTASNPFYTLVTLRGGRIVNIERTRKF